MQSATFDIKKAFKAVTEQNELAHVYSAISSAISQFAWYAVYFVYLPDMRLLLFVWQFLVVVIPILVSVYRKRLGINGAQCQLFTVFFIAPLGWCLLNVCPEDIRLVVLLGTSVIFLGPAFLSFWPMRYYYAVIIFSVILDIFFYLTLSKLSFSDFLILNIFPTAIAIILGAFLLRNRSTSMLKKEHFKWSMEQSERQLSALTQKTKAELDFLIYSISHDLRSPILSVKGLLSLISDFEKLTPEQQSYLKMADSSVERLDQTIFDMLDLANNARTDLKPIQFNIREMVQQIFDDLKFLSKTPVNFIIEIEGSDYINGDPKRIKTIIKNLASNAVKYRKKDDNDAFVKFKLLRDKDIISFEILDNGIGIPPEEQEKIFEMFYRYATHISGSGLGLFIVKQILSKIGAEIFLESNAGQGSKFTVTLAVNCSTYQHLNLARA